MNKKFLFWFSTIFICFAFQILSSSALSIFGVFPNFLILSTIFFALYYGPLRGTILGFIWGLFADSSSICIFGSQTFMLTLIGYVSGRFQRKIDEEKPIAQMGLVLLMSIFYVWGLIFFESLFTNSSERLRSEISFIQPVYSTVMSPLFFWLLMRWKSLFHFHEY